MKRNNKLLFALMAIFLMITSIYVHAEPSDINTISIDCNKTSVTVGEEVGSFTITNNTEGIEIVPYDGENTAWVYDEKGWVVYNHEAFNKGETYGLKIKFTLESGYQLGDSPEIVFNGTVKTASIEPFDGGGYLYIELGSAITPPPETYKYSVDLNGGTWTRSAIPETIQDGERVYISDFSDRNDLIPPKLKAFDALEINGNRYESGYYTVVGDTSIKFLWKDVEETEDYSIHFYDEKDVEFNIPYDNPIDITLEFTEEAGVDFAFYAQNFGIYTEDFMNRMVEALEWSEEELAENLEWIESIKAQVKSATKEYGTLIDFYNFNLYGDSHVYINGPFKMKIKMTDEMKKYKKFKMVYLISTEDGFNISETGDAFDFKANGDYVEGTLGHLSTYALVGIEEEEETVDPKTGDNVLPYIVIALLSVGCLLTVKIVKNQE